MSDQMVSNSGDRDGGAPAMDDMVGGGEMVEALDDIGRDFEQLEEDFGDLGLGTGGGDGSEMQALEEASQGTPFATSKLQLESTTAMGILEIADMEEDEDEEGLGDWLKGAAKKVVGAGKKAVGAIKNAIMKRARKIIGKITALVRRYGAKVRRCIAKVTKAIRAFRARKWGTAIKEAWAAYRCIRAATS